MRDKNKSMKNSLLFVLPIILISSAWAYEFKDSFSAEYAQIIELIESNSWKEIEDYESENIKCGFGPNEEGPGCIENLLSNNHQCKEKILFALYQGCKLVHESKQTKCFSPPQSKDQDIIFPPLARVVFRFESSNSQVTIDSMICGGD